MLLDEVIRKEAESENWSLNSWNSGSDSSNEDICSSACMAVGAARTERGKYNQTVVRM